MSPTNVPPSAYRLERQRSPPDDPDGKTIVTPANRRLRAAAALLLGLGAACNDSPSAPRSGTVRVTVRTSGGDPDFDGYEVVLDQARRTVDANRTAEFRYIGAGTRSLTLAGVAENCSIGGASPRSVTVTRNQTVDVTFDVECATTGIAVTTQTTGVDSPDSVAVVVNGEGYSPAAANGLLVTSRLRPGRYTVALVLPGTNCSVVGGSEVTVDVSARTVTPVRFEVTCVAPIRSEKIAFAVDTTIEAHRKR